MNRQQALDALADAVIPEAIEWVKELKRYRVYVGKDRDYFHKARIALGVVSNGVRLCATRENARTNDLIESRLLKGGDPITKPMPLLEG